MRIPHYIELEINLTFKESIFGTKKNFNINLKKACKFCKQTGAKSASDVVICSTCQGKGFVNVVQRTIFSGAIRTQVVCNSCSGKGKVIKNRCPECLGKKLINKIEEVSFVVPKGINPDTEYKYPNLGNDGLIGGKKGDIFVKFNVNKDSYFIRKGNDVHVKVPISFFDAILGANVKIVTLECIEKVMLKPGVQVDDNIIFKNKGCFIGINRVERGDFYVWWQIRFPINITDSFKKALTVIKDSFNWDPNNEFIEKNFK